MYRNCPEEPRTAYQLINGDTPRQTYPERDDVEVVEVDVAEIRNEENERKYI